MLNSDPVTVGKQYIVYTGLWLEQDYICLVFFFFFLLLLWFIMAHGMCPVSKWMNSVNGRESFFLTAVQVQGSETASHQQCSHYYLFSSSTNYHSGRTQVLKLCPVIFNFLYLPDCGRKLRQWWALDIIRYIHSFVGQNCFY